MKEFRVEKESELGALVTEVITELAAAGEREDCGGAAVLALHGDLGAGKTTFMQTLARELGVAEQVTSPTFVVMKKYDTEHDTIKHLTHIDAYRIEDIDEMRPLRFTEELAAEETIIGIEWAENISDLLPAHTIHLNFAIEGEGRVITMTDAQSS